MNWKPLRMQLIPTQHLIVTLAQGTEALRVAMQVIENFKKFIKQVLTKRDPCRSSY